MKNITFKTHLQKGTKGSKGERGVNFEVPTGGIIGYLGDSIPDGYEETDAPAAFRSTDITQYKIAEIFISKSTITANGEVLEV